MERADWEWCASKMRRGALGQGKPWILLGALPSGVDLLSCWSGLVNSLATVDVRNWPRKAERMGRRM